MERFQRIHKEIYKSLHQGLASQLYRRFIQAMIRTSSYWIGLRLIRIARDSEAPEAEQSVKAELVKVSMSIAASIPVLSSEPLIQAMVAGDLPTVAGFLAELHVPCP
jgi:hypothetical protein